MNNAKTYEISISKTLNYNSDDLTDVISSAVYDIGYWCTIDNSTDVWEEISNSLPEDRTFEDVMFAMLDRGNAIQLLDKESDDVWELTMDKLLNGIKMAIETQYWDGDFDSIDGEVGDVIFQYALFNEIVFG